MQTIDFCCWCTCHATYNCEISNSI